MTLNELLTTSRIDLNASISSKKKALEQLAALLASGTSHLDALAIFDALAAREKLGSTGFGDGIAIPHARVNACNAPRCAVITLDPAIDFDAIDRNDVDILWALIVPEEATDQHLNILAAVAELLGKHEYRQAIRAAQTCDQLFDVIARSQEN